MKLTALFESAGLTLNVALTATDADVIKTYAQLGLGIGIIASMAIRPSDPVVAIDVDELFPPHVTWVGFRRGRLLRNYMREFVKRVAPHVTRRTIDEAIRASTQEQVADLFRHVELPVR